MAQWTRRLRLLDPARAVFPEPRAPMIATRPGLRSTVSLMNHFDPGTWRLTMRPCVLEAFGGSRPMWARVLGERHASRNVSKVGSPLSQQNRSSSGTPRPRQIVRVAPVEAWLQASIDLDEFILRQHTISQPELCLLGVATEHDVCQGLNRLSPRSEGAGFVTDARGPVSLAARHSNKGRSCWPTCSSAVVAVAPQSSP